MAQSGERPSSRDFANPAEIAAADEQGFPHKGKMDFVENRFDPSTDTIQGRAIFENKDLGLIPGLFVRLRLLGSGKYQALLLPDEAINSDQTQKFIWVVKPDDTVEYRKITFGPIFDGLRVIHEGLKADERVIIEGVQRARPGIKVKPEERAISSAPEKPSAVAIPAGMPKHTGESTSPKASTPAKR